MDQCYLHVKTVFLGGGTQRTLLVRPSPSPSALIKRGDSWPLLSRVELILKVSTIYMSLSLCNIHRYIQRWGPDPPLSPCRINTKSKHHMYMYVCMYVCTYVCMYVCSGTTPSTSPSPFQDRGGREGGVVAATSRDTITQHI